MSVWIIECLDNRSLDNRCFTVLVILKEHVQGWKVKGVGDIERACTLMKGESVGDLARVVHVDDSNTAILHFVPWFFLRFEHLALPPCWQCHVWRPCYCQPVHWGMAEVRHSTNRSAPGTLWGIWWCSTWDQGSGSSHLWACTGLQPHVDRERGGEGGEGERKRVVH